ncbi:hypothetical protein [Roseomonas populi]|uniref:Yip1 domain-containing protein n=1 Tax=Roseomonas populi TaxID=3121582 RepID=A0ABT1XAC3_9PROT|nr:hypothetical protein [Roseomonas pecuniae]MCR0985072.1 hypothetical protein [Roseomonas pecuniae]
MSTGQGPPIDSRRWTGPEPAAPPLDRRGARAAFLAAGGPGAAAPQRAASAASWAGLALLPFVVLAGAEPGASLLGLEPTAARLRGGLEALLSPSLGLKGAGGMVSLLGDPRLLAALLALGGSAVGIASAWRHRAALARGFAAAEAGVPGVAFRTHRYWEAAPFVLLLVAWRPLGGDLLLLNALALWLLARLAAGTLTALAERRAAGLGARSPASSGWDLASLVLSLGALLLLLAYLLGLLA